MQENENNSPVETTESSVSESIAAEPETVAEPLSAPEPAEPADSSESSESEAAAPADSESLSADEILAPDQGGEQPKWPAEDAELMAMLEAVIYITDEPLTLEQISTALEQPRDRIKRLLDELVAEWQKPQHGLAIREVAGGYKMATKAEHHEAVRQFVKSLQAPMKLSLPALETLAVIAYKQPVTAPEVMEIRGVQGAGVLKTLIERKLIAPSGRKNVIGKPILYKTTKEFLVQFGLKDLAELPSVKEFEELARFSTPEPEAAPEAAPEAPSPEPEATPVAEPEPASSEPVEATNAEPVAGPPVEEEVVE
jgi:segregation and condensation protein B